MINETSNILRQERIQKEVKSLEPFCNQIRELQIQNQLVKKENALYKQKFELFERLLQAQQQEIVRLNKRITRLELHGEIENRLESLEESIALIVNSCNTNDRQCRINSARTDTMKGVKIKESLVKCQLKKEKHNTMASRR
jgi:ClpP class serine protease